jgi:hypothetical protein
VVDVADDPGRAVLAAAGARAARRIIAAQQFDLGGAVHRDHVLFLRVVTADDPVEQLALRLLGRTHLMKAVEQIVEIINVKRF